jgi:hypothetical protein
MHEGTEPRSTAEQVSDEEIVDLVRRRVPREHWWCIQALWDASAAGLLPHEELQRMIGNGTVLELGQECQRRLATSRA